MITLYFHLQLQFKYELFHILHINARKAMKAILFSPFMNPNNLHLSYERDPWQDFKT